MGKLKDFLDRKLQKKEEKGVHGNIHSHGAKEYGISDAGRNARAATGIRDTLPNSAREARSTAKRFHHNVLEEMKEQKKPNLPKSEEMSKAKVDEGKSKEQKQADRRERNSRVKFAVGSPEGEYKGKKVRPRKEGEGDKVFGEPKKEQKGVHHRAGWVSEGRSMAGEHSERSKKPSQQKEYHKLMARDQHKKRSDELKQMPKPNLPKSEKANKAKELKKMFGRPDNTTVAPPPPPPAGTSIADKIGFGKSEKAKKLKDFLKKKGCK